MQRYRTAYPTDVYVGRQGDFDLFSDNGRSLLVVKNGQGPELVWRNEPKRMPEPLTGERSDAEIKAMQACWRLVNEPDPSVSPRSGEFVRRT